MKATQMIPTQPTSGLHLPNDQRRVVPPATQLHAARSAKCGDTWEQGSTPVSSASRLRSKRRGYSTEPGSSPDISGRHPNVVVTRDRRLFGSGPVRMTCRLPRGLPHVRRDRRSLRMAAALPRPSPRRATHAGEPLALSRRSRQLASRCGRGRGRSCWCSPSSWASFSVSPDGRVIAFESGTSAVTLAMVFVIEHTRAASRLPCSAKSTQLLCALPEARANSITPEEASEEPMQIVEEGQRDRSGTPKMRRDPSS